MALAEKELQPGDHIYIRRHGLFYSHHGIYVNNGKVIHFTGEGEKEKKNPNVRETSLEEFLRGGKLKRRNYKKRLLPSETVEIARDHLSNKDYSLIFNNCEHFATYCATRKKKSKQIKGAMGSIALVIFTVGGITIRNRRRRKNI